MAEKQRQKSGSTTNVASVGEKPSAQSGIFHIGGELPVYRLGFGAMRITGDGIWGEPRDHDEVIRVLRRALELGINFIDTADSYGPDVSERLIAEALYPYPKGLVIASKAGFVRTGPNQWTINGRPEHLRAACEGSLRRLRVDRIDLYQLHRIDPEVPAEDQLGVFKDLQAQGKIRYIGLSEVTVPQIEHARKIVPVVTVQNRYSLADRTYEDILGYCEREKIGFIPWNPINAGNLGALGEELEGVARRHRVTTAQLALAWLLWRSPVMLPIPGTSKVTHLEENVAAATLKVDDRELQGLDRAA
jgi:aryl-alcohol dehydrogenase-like predicted oxidoreductase